MDISEYLNKEVELEEYIGNDNDFRADEYSPTETIYAREEGGTRFIRQADGNLYESDKWYLVGQKLKAKSRINGQTIKSTKEFYDLDGTFIYLEAYV